MVSQPIPQQPAMGLPRQPQTVDSSVTVRRCPAWCCVLHGEQLGEEDHLHLGEPVIVGRATIRLCATIDPVTNAQDGPYVLFGEEEYSLVEAEALLAVLQTQLETAREGVTRPEAP